MSKRTDAEIAKEISELERIKPQIPDLTFFGESNHDAIDAAIMVLREEMEQNEIYARWNCEEDEDLSQRELDEALAAFDWMNGEGESLSGNWKESFDVV